MPLDLDIDADLVAAAPAPRGDAPSFFDDARWDDRFARLPSAFFTRLDPTPLPDPYLVAASDDAAATIGATVESLSTGPSIAVLAGNRVPRGAEPLAAVYSGHQFGVWAGQLGDGRAHLLGGIAHDGAIVELQLKGAGKTPYSRMGDGRAVLRSSIREFLCSEAMHGLGIPTTRALAVVGSDRPVMRETVETAAVVMRMAPSFVRFGSFEHWFSRGRHDELRILADSVIDSFYPGARDAANPYQALLASVVDRTAKLVARWQAVGFCHGVMNTDNMSILGLTLDYGPFGFLDGFDANHVCNHSDEQSRYSYARQPAVARWNLYCLAEALMPLLETVEVAEAALEPFKDTFGRAMDDAIHAKLGLASSLPDDRSLIDATYQLLQSERIDFTIFFRRLCDLDRAAVGGEARDLFIDRDAFDRWASLYRTRLAQEARDPDERRLAMRAVNPRFVLRNHLAEEAIRLAKQKDFSEVRRLHEVLSRPYDDQPAHERYAELPPAWAGQLEVSCSS